MEEEESESLLIFKFRGKEEAKPRQNAEAGKGLAVSPPPSEPVPANAKPQEMPKGEGLKPAYEVAYEKELAAKKEGKSGPGWQPRIEAQAHGEKNIAAKPIRHKETTCINHPWRPAFAECTTCKLSYCYPDIMEYGGRYYCLKDIDNAFSQKVVAVNPAVNMFETMSAGLFIFTALMFAYFIYPQASFVVNYVGGHGMALTIANLRNLNFYSAFLSAILSAAAKYYIQTANIAIAVFGFVAGLVMLKATRRAVFFGAAVSALSLIMTSYEYLSFSQITALNFTYLYLLIAAVLSFINLVLIAFSQASSITESKNERAGLPQVEWPVAETY